MCTCSAGDPDGVERVIVDDRCQVDDVRRGRALKWRRRGGDGDEGDKGGHGELRDATRHCKVNLVKDILCFQFFFVHNLFAPYWGTGTRTSKEHHLAAHKNYVNSGS